MQKSSKHTFHKGMNQDLDTRFLEEGMYRYALNIKESNTGQEGSIETEDGNQEVFISLPTGANRVVGGVEDHLNNRIIYLLFNELDSHGIYEYNYKTGLITNLLQSSLLEFPTNTSITGIELIESKHLYWTDGETEPKHINLDRLSNSEYPSTLTEGDITLLKPRPITPPEANYSTDTSYKSNNLRGRLFQFAVRYQYKDDQITPLSPYTPVVIPTTEANDPVMSGVAGISENNIINVTASEPREEVRKVDFCYREGNTGDWRVFKTLDNPEEELSCVFYGSGYINTISQEDQDNLFDRVPSKAKTLAYTKENKLLLGNVTEGYDLPDTNISAEVEVFEAETSSSGFAITDTSDATKLEFEFSTIGAAGTSVRLDITLPPHKGGTAIEDTNFSRFAKNISITYTVKTGDTVTSVNNYFYNQISPFSNILIRDGLSTVTGDLYTRSRTGAKITLTYNTISTFYRISNASVVITNTEVSVKTLKRGTKGRYGIVYYDTLGRSAPVATEDSYEYYVPKYSESSEYGVAKLNISIDHTPPSWATHYEIYVAPSTQSENSVITRIATVTNVSGDIYQLSLEPLKTYSSEVFEDKSINEYTKSLVYGYTNNDRLRLIYDTSASDYFSTDIDTLILDFDGVSATPTVTVEIDSSVTIADGDWIELYSPKAEADSLIYYGTGQVFEITSDQHQGNTQNQNTGTSTPAILQLDFGDAYSRTRTMVDSLSAPETIILESFNFSDYYPSKVYDRGQPNLVDPSYKLSTKEGLIRISDALIPDTEINGLNNFKPLNFIEADKNYGSVQHLHQLGNYIDVYQENRVGRVPVGVVNVYYADGGTQQLRNPDEYATIEYYSAEYGIGLNPETFASHGNNRYFQDLRRGAVIRLGANGMKVISDYGMKKSFFDSSRLYGVSQERSVGLSFSSIFEQANGIYKTPQLSRDDSLIELTLDEITGEGGDPNFYTLSDTIDSFSTPVSPADLFYDTATGNYFRVVLGRLQMLVGSYVAFQITIPIGGLIRYRMEQISFNEKKNSWTTYHSYSPELMLPTNNDIVTFYGGKLYTHDNTANQSLFYGTQYDSIIETEISPDPTQQKVWLSIGEHSATKWEAVITNEKSQETDIYEEDLEDLEGDQYATLLMDKNTPNVTYPVINGDPMRSDTLNLRLTCVGTSKASIFGIFVKYILSHFSKH